MKYIYISIICSLISLGSADAQKVEISGSRVFINCDGLPMYSQCPANIPIAYFLQYYTINSTNEITYPAKKFEVSNYDSDYQTQSWVWAAKKCENLNENGKNWRLPNQKELFLIFVLRPAIESKSGFTQFSNGFYMSGLVSTKESAFPYPQTQVDLTNGNSKSGGAEAGYYIRCVRDQF